MIVDTRLTMHQSTYLLQSPDTLMRLMLILVDTLTLKGCAKWPAGRIPRWKKQSEPYQPAGKAPALS